ncbi:MAG: hypothetical protein Q4B42_03860 [Oscillospiraceae bacterium]|nr:hypothetical protein [Oscillospiraceae bacterium]
MSVLLVILKILGWLLLGLLALLIIALFIPLKLCFRYEKGALNLEAGALGFKFDILNREESVAEKDSVEEEKEKKESAEGKRKSAPKPDLDTLRELMGAGGSALRRILGSLKFRRVSVVLVAHGWDAYETGVNTGRIWTGLGAALTLLLSLWPDASFEKLVVIPDFMDEHGGEESVYFEVLGLPATFVLAGLIFGGSFIKMRLRAYFESRGQNPEERTCEE